MQINEFNLTTRLLTDFSVIIILIIIFGINSIYRSNQLAIISIHIVKHPLTVGIVGRDMQINIYAIDRSMKDAAFARNNEKFENAVKIVNNLNKRVLEKFEIISSVSWEILTIFKKRIIFLLSGRISKEHYNNNSTFNSATQIANLTIP